MMQVADFYIEQLKLSNFKNYAFITLDFDQKLNFIVGNNGIGKTNLLDAVYYSCISKSYFSADGMVPNFNNNYFRIESNVLLNTDNHLIEVKYLKQEKKEIFVDKLKVDKQADYIGRFPCVIISPDDNQLILGASEQRRKFIDSTICQFSAAYLSALVMYNKLLTQRNALLKYFFENKTYNADLLNTYDEQLALKGQFIYEFRKSFLQNFTPKVKEIYHAIFEGPEVIEIQYNSDLNEKGAAELLKENIKQDRYIQRTTKGIHTDDLSFSLNYHPVKKTGSQGQQKTFLLSLKLAQYELIKNEKNIKPLLLLDDIFDKLDAGRIDRLFRLIQSNEFGQVFITDTDEQRIQAFITNSNITNYKIIKVGSI